MVSARIVRLLVLFGGLGYILAPAAPTIHAQQAATQQTGPTRVVGAITAINGKSLTVKPDSAAPTTVTVSDTAHILRSAPGAKTVASATPIHLTDLVVGDRVLMAVRPAPDGSGPMATVIIAMTQADVTKQHLAEEEDWQRRGVGGIAKAVDPATGAVTIANNLNRTLTIHTTPKTVIRRYTPGSIQFADAKLATLNQIMPGDQVRALGNHSADGSEVEADEIVAGTFRNIAGNVLSTDPAANTITVRDLSTKKPVVVQINAESELHKLPAPGAQMLAARFGSAVSQRGQTGEGARGSGQGHGRARPATGSPQNGGESHGMGAGQAERTLNVSQILQRAPAIHISDLHRGDDVMIVGQGAPGSSIIAATLLAGVEPIFAASASASHNLFSASWDLGGQGGDSGGQGDSGGSSGSQGGGPSK
ncbi:MAG: hypothetical protein ABI076_05625 [Acidobacteriaceae bacterium]